MSYNGSGTFNINSAGQPVVSGTVISSTAFNALTADLATGLTTALTKDGQTTPTANITLGGYKITNLAAGTAAADAVRFSQLQGGSTSTYITAAGADTITGTVTPTLTAYATGQQFSFVAAGTNTTAVTLNIDGVGAKAVTRAGTTALAAGDILAGQVALVEYDGTQFQLLDPNAFTNLRVSGLLTQAAGADIASAATINLSTATGNGPRITGTTAISAVTMTTGQQVLVVADGALPLTYNATTNKLNSAAASVTLSAGDMVLYSKDLSGIVHGNIIKADGSSVTSSTSINTVPRLIENVGLAVTMAANAVTIAIKGANGSDPSASNIAGVSFRNATLTNGQSSKVSVIAALSTVISSGSTAGTVNAQASRIWVAGILVSGAVELAWYQSVSGTSIGPINENGVITTVAEGGSGAADSAQVWYSTTARTAVPFTILGYFESTQATAGTWATAASSIVINPYFRPGSIIQDTYNQTGTSATGTTAIPYDNTIPQITEGDQFMSQAIIPSFAGNVLQIEHRGFFSNSASTQYTSALFQDSTANALSASASNMSAVARSVLSRIDHRMIAGTASSTTFKIRLGQTSGTTTFLGESGAALYGGVGIGTLLVKEIMA